MKSINGTIIFVVSLLIAFISCDAFGLNSANSDSKIPVSATATTSRQNFLAAMAGSLMTTAALTAPAPVWAKDIDYKPGSKNDPDVQAKLSLCMYECTKPKGAEQKSRAECLPECKAKCITAK
mmetsp:Transcript_23167/g.54777  ORF Transcript_23167/g.54777 Transcript_23167/m.54777 type:complete len:123 (+) Transcript_23167:138-506(+)|eukprot:CAMPEP_0197183764 /NCGR_PEP_ID=MMETSP1423-20130617/8260_1 /TAXON_ID=476441 /ORGANISM="Pseudo-nitzschia heimii, Strain UNC1101" /LENGTH=122 /DNA_ID=CAMNT_0042634387 /DNA_START=84 /DNA_END=452 /DNA_ORIENTATION=-